MIDINAVFARATSFPTWILPTPCTRQLSDPRLLPTGDAFADSDFSTSWFAFGFYLDFWRRVSWRPWAMCFLATELVEPRVNQTWEFDAVWILRWVGPRPFASRRVAMISVWYVLGQWNTTTMMLCLWSMCFFFGPEDLLCFTYLAICRGWPPCLVHYAHYAVASLEGSCGLITR